MNKRKNEYVISFSGLKDGTHVFNYKIGNSFFEQLDYSEIKKADLNVTINFEKGVTMMIAQFNIEGVVEIMCDRCTDEFTLPVKGTNELIYKFSEADEDDEKIICLHDDETEIDFTQPIYEFTTLLLPSKRLHNEGDCNQEMLEVMDDYLMVESDTEDIDSDDEEKEIDPRWSALQKLKKNK